MPAVASRSPDRAGRGRSGSGALPASVHQIRFVSGSADSYGSTPVQLRQLPRAGLLLHVHQGRGEAARPVPFGQPPAAEWCEQATTPGRIPSVTQTLSTKWPISVSIRTRSPVSTPSRCGVGRCASTSGSSARSRPATWRCRCGCGSASGAGRSRAARTRSPPRSISSGWTWLRMYVRDRQLRPAEVRERRRVELELARRSRGSRTRVSVDTTPIGRPAPRHGRRARDDVLRRRGRALV